MIRRVIAVRGPAHNDVAIFQKQTGTVVLRQRIEGDGFSMVSGSIHSRGDRDGAAKFFRSAGYINGV